MSSTDPWPAEEPVVQEEPAGESKPLDATEDDQDDIAEGQAHDDEDEDEDEDALAIDEVRSLSLASAPPSAANPWADTLPADPLAPSFPSRPTLSARDSSSLSIGTATSTGGAAASGTTATLEHSPAPSSTGSQREWAEYDASLFGVGLEKLGHGCARYWSFKPRYTNLNAGAFGTCPNAVCQVYKEIQDEIESCPDYFVDTTLPKRLQACRERIAPLLNVSSDDVVFVPNTTTAFHSVVRDLPSIFEEGDAVLTVSTTYGAVGLNVQHLVDSRGEKGKLRRVEVPLRWPLSDDDLLKTVEEVIVRDQSQEALQTRGGKGKIRLAVFDAISSMPGIRLPWEKLVTLAKKYDIMTFIDGAHAIGQIELDVGTVDPDFFVSNCHKWLHAHRGCAVFYVAKRNQHIVHGVPISWMYLAASQRAEQDAADQEGATPANSWRAQWEFAGTIDWSSLLTVEAALDFRQRLGGERRIMAYTHWVALRGGQLAAKTLGTEVLEILEDEKISTVTNDADGPEGDSSAKTASTDSKLPQRQRPHTMSLVNIRLPLLSTVYSASLPAERKAKLKAYFFRVLWEEFRTVIPTYEHADRYWARMSGAVFLEVGDFEYGARALKEVCRRLNENVAEL